MNEQIAERILYAITAAGAVAWLAGLRFLVASGQARKLAAQQANEQMELPEPLAENLIFGTAHVVGRPEELSNQASTVLARGTASILGLIKILDRKADRLTFERAGPSVGGQFGQSPVERGQIRFTSEGRGQTRIDYAINVSGGRGLLLGGIIFQFLGLIALVVGFWAIHTYIVPNPNPAVRGQVFQMLQMVHFLWPPFLFGGIYRLRDRRVRSAFDALAHNLPHMKA